MNDRKIFLCLIALLMELSFVSCEIIPINLFASDKDKLNFELQQPDEASMSSGASNVKLKSGDLIPDGVLISTDSENILTYLDANGYLVSEIQTPGIINVESNDVHIAGIITPESLMPPIIYRSWSPEQALLVNNDKHVSSLRQTDSYLSMIGALGQPVISFSEVKLNKENYPHSYLFTGNLDNLDSVEPFIDLVDDLNYLALMPVGIKTIGEEPQGIWYTKTGWGIGGADLIFPITRGLYFYDLTNGKNIRFLSENRSFQGLSPDLTFAGSVEFDYAGDRSMHVVHLPVMQEISFDLESTSNRGSGFAVFSPDNHYVAWLEASGSMISDQNDFNLLVRVGDLQTGNVIQVIDDTSTAKVINKDTVLFMLPVGWLTNNTLMVEVHSQNWDNVTLLCINITTNEMSLFASGKFIGFGYQ